MTRINLKLQISLLKKGEVVYETTIYGKTKVSRFLQMRNLAELKYDYGIARVTYHSTKNLYNEFPFRTLDQLSKGWSEAVEPALLQHVAEGAW